MRRLALLALVLPLIVLAMGREPVNADTCTCPWQVIQFSSTNSDCNLATYQNTQNAWAAAYFYCNGHGQDSVCTHVRTDLGCTVNGDGTATDTSLINFKCTACP